MGYRGELMMKFKLTTDALPRVYQIGDKIGQLVVVPYYKATPVFVEELSSTDRGENGYGSTDKKEKSGTDLILETKELAKNVQAHNNVPYHLIRFLCDRCRPAFLASSRQERRIIGTG